MSLADAATQVPSGAQLRASCSVGRVVDVLGSDDRALLAEWLAPTSGRVNSWIAQVLTADGHRSYTGRSISYQMVQRHRTQVCGCFL